MTHFKNLSIILLVLCYTNIYANKPKLSINEALDIVFSQQALSQHLARVYLALCNNTLEPKFYQERDASIQTFDEQLHQLSLFIPTDKVKVHIQNVRNVWKNYKEIAAWTIKKDAASKLLKQSAEILQALKGLHAAYQEYEKSLYIAEENASLLDISQYIKHSQNQEILNQRIIFNYLAEKQGIDAVFSHNQLIDAQKTFISTLDILSNAKPTSKKIQSKIAYIKENWSGINSRLTTVDKDQSYVDDMLNRSDMISKTLKQIIKRYQELSLKLSISYAINATTAQSMHIQQIAKTYIASSSDNAGYKYKKEVLEHLDHFEKTMTAMSVKAPAEEIKNAIRVVQVMWKNYKKLVSDFERMDEVRVIKVLEQCHVLMAACDRVADEVEYYAQTIPAYKAFSEKDGVKISPSLDITRQIQVSSRLRIYAHRVALYYMMTCLNLDNDVSSKRLNNSINEIDKYLNELKNSKLNSSPMTVLLESCNTEWDWIKSTSSIREKNKIDIEPMLEKSELLSKKLSKLTDLYEHRMNDMFSEDLDDEETSDQVKK